MGIAWTPETDAHLIRLTAAGLSAGTVADILGTTEGAVQSRRSRTRALLPKAVTQATRERIVELHGEGWRPSRIARQVGISPETIAGFVALLPPPARHADRRVEPAVQPSPKVAVTPVVRMAAPARKVARKRPEWAGPRIETPHDRLMRTCGEIAKGHGVTLQQLLGPSRKRRLVDARTEAYRYLASQGLSYPRIGRIFNRDHTTVLFGAKRQTTNEKQSCAA